MAKTSTQGGVTNYLGNQKTVSALPIKWKSAPNHPETELAYITKAEKNLLLKKDIHGSLKNGPNTGPEGIMSLDSQGSGFGGPGPGRGGEGPGDQGDFRDTAQHTEKKADYTKDRTVRGDNLTDAEKRQYEKNRKERKKDPYYGTPLEGSGVTPTTSIATEEQEKEAKKEAKKDLRNLKKIDDARRRSKINAILNKKKTYSTFKIDPETGKLVEDEEVTLGGTDTTVPGANPFGIDNKEYQDLISSLPSTKGAPELPPGVEPKGMEDLLAKTLSKNNLKNSALNELFEKNDRYSGVNLEAFQNEFNLPQTGLTSLDVALGFASPFLEKGAKKSREFFSGTEKGLGKTIFGDPRKSVLGAGKYTFDGKTIDPTTFAMLDPALMNDVYKDYTDRRSSGEIDGYGNPNPNFGSGSGGDNYVPPIIPTVIPEDETEEEEVVPPRNLGGLAPRFAGSIFDFTGLADGGRAGAMDGGRMMQMDMMNEEDDPVGGIMDLETLRNQYFFGGIVKSAKKAVKSATRAVKKIAKSPIGKAALLYAGGSYLSGMGAFGNLKGAGFLKTPAIGFKNFMMGKPLGFKTAMDSVARGPGFLDMIGGKAGAGILGASALSYFMTPKEEEKFNNDEYYAANSLDIPNIRNNPFKFLSARNQGSRFAADGGLMRTGYAEGSEEPVAKKTMPLLDMEGQEMDLREEGGFVPLGRMERADDVPARLSKNEFVFTADAVRNAGEGDIDKGAEVMYNMMKNLESGGEVSEESQGLEGAREMFKTSQRLEEVI